MARLQLSHPRTILGGCGINTNRRAMIDGTDPTILSSIQLHFSNAEEFRKFPKQPYSRCQQPAPCSPFVLIDKLAVYPIFNQGGDSSIIARLKKSWSSYHHNARQVMANFGKDARGRDDNAAIATWHYRMSCRAEKERKEDNLCRYCPNTKKGCGCYYDIKVWWEACELAALVLPSSGTAESVFSLTKMLFSDRQGSLLSDALQLSLFLAFNRRDSA